MKEKVLIIGASGLIGQELTHTLTEAGFKVIPSIEGGKFELFPRKKIKLDLRDKEEVHNVINSERPEIIVNVNGLVGFQDCARRPKIARLLNVRGVGYVIDSSLIYKPLLVKFSTDAVFSGDEGLYSEEGEREPKSVYGKTFLKGDLAIENSTLPYLILRPSVVYGRYRFKQMRNRFIDNVISSLVKGRKFEAMTNTYNSPTFLVDLCDALIFLLKRKARGTFHVAGPERLSKYEFSLKIAMELGLKRKLLVPIKSTSKLDLASYPVDTSLDITKLRKSGYSTIGIAEGLKRYKEGNRK